MKRNEICLFAAFILIGMPFVLMMWLPEPSPVNRTNCERIQIGMSIEEVTAIMGGPPTFGAGPPAKLRNPKMVWVGPNGDVVVNFNGRRVDTSYLGEADATFMPRRDQQPLALFRTLLEAVGW